MKISLAGIMLADASAGLPPQELKLNGARVVELVDFARATSKGVFWRGNSQNTLTFSTSRGFDTLADAQDAFFLAEAQTPTQGALLIRQTGADANRPPLGASNAVVQSVVPSILGVRVDTAYTIQAGRLAGGSALPYVTDPNPANIMLGATPIPNGQNFVAVNFQAPINNPVVTGASIIAPTGADSPGVWKIEQLTGAAQGGNGGFVAYLTAPVPTAGYILHWSAAAGAV